uniref:DCD domain-containing protein n=1 Tax=Triticum urartu TaxID=4572 RepID=A0A8R7RA95_TRIUA
MLLFVFEREEKKLSGVFEATSDGALNILPNAFRSSRKPRPAQVRFRRVWFCKPLTEAEFSDEIKGLQPQMSFFGISYQQVCDLNPKCLSLVLSYQKVCYFMFVM